MKCPKCRFENPEGMKFCGECGYDLRQTPEPISDVYSHPQSYTPKHLADKILTTRSAIEGERKMVTVLFADVANYTSMSEKLDPESVHQVMDGCFKIIMNQIHNHEGTINQFTGDGIMALFGAPLAHEDHAQKACYAALSIQESLQEYKKLLNDKFGVDFNMRIGINSGPVVVGSIGNDLRMDYTAVGDTTNLAARMESLAQPGTILVSKNTYQKLNPYFDFEVLGKYEVKGKLDQQEAYKLNRQKDRSHLGFTRKIYSEMVGRDAELNKLELQVLKAVNGEGSIVNVIGEAGIGKSRLIAELKQKDVIKKVALHEGRAISMGKGLSFYPSIDIYKNWAKIKEGDSDATAINKLEASIRSVTQQDVNEILPFIATLMGIKLTGRYAERVRGIEGEALEKLILKNVKDLLIKSSELIPIVIVIEDLHWADLSSIELQESLFRLAETQRILFINVFRPGYKETGDRIVATITEKLPVYYVELVLEPLDERMSQALITNMLNISGFQHEVIQKIIQRAGGNPFFIEEIVRSLIDERAIILKDGKFQVTERIARITIPNSISDVLMARIDRLEEQTRNLLKIASILGRNFFYRVLLEVASTVEDIDGRLSYLKEIQLIREHRRMGEVEYLFKHALTQEVAYESILLQKRKALHLEVASSIEKVFVERLHEFYGKLAYHYSKAENLDKAEEYLIKAGEEALKSSASNEALHYYKEALDLYLKKYGDDADREKVAILDKNIALALFNKGQCDEAVEYFDKALNYYWGKLPTHAISATFMFLSAFLHFIIALYLPVLKFRKIPTQRDNEGAGLYFKKCEALTIINNKRFFIESFYFYKKLTDFDLTKFELGLKIFVAASVLFSFTGISFKLSRKILDCVKHKVSEIDTKSFITYELLETVHNYFQGNWEAIKAYDDDLVNKNLSLGEIYSASHHLFWHGLPSIYQGSLHIGESIVNRLNDIYEVYENEVSILFKQLLNTSLLLECRKLNDALIEIEQGIEFGQKTNQGLFLIHMLSCKASIQILMGDIEEAEESLGHAEKIKRKVYSAPWQLSNFRRSRLKFDLYRLEESIRKNKKRASFEYRNKAFKSGHKFLKQSRKVVQHRTESYRLMGEYYGLINKKKKALKWWNRSIKEGKRLGARLELARTYFEVGKRMLAFESKYKELDGVNAEGYLEKARVLFEEMNLQWDLDELDRVTRSKGSVFLKLT